MAEEVLAQAGLHFDELYKIRVIDPDVAQQTGQLKEECSSFLEHILQFQTIATKFSSMTENLAKIVDEEKMKAIASRNLLKSMSKQREAEQQQLKSLIDEKRRELERLRNQFASLSREDREQTDLIEQLILQK